MARGDHIKVRRVFGVFYHHGIDLGDGTVIHFTGEPSKKSNASVKITSMEEFLEGGKLEIVPYSKPLNIEKTIKKAKKQVGISGYNLFYRNCEHFATYCKTGTSESEQIKNKRKALLIGARKLGYKPSLGTLALGALIHKIFKWKKSF